MTAPDAARVKELREWIDYGRKEADRCGWVKDVASCDDLIAILDALPALQEENERLLDMADDLTERLRLMSTRAEKAEAENAALKAVLLAKVSTKYKAKVPVFRDLMEKLQKAEAENAALKAVLTELWAIIKGECPGLLRESSGGVEIGMMIDAALAVRQENGTASAARCEDYCLVKSDCPQFRRNK